MDILWHQSFSERRDIIRVLRGLSRSGYDNAQAASVSVRLDDSGHFLFCSSSYFVEKPTPDLVFVHNLGHEVPEPGILVGDDVSLHRDVYAFRDDIRAIVHAQPVYATAFASSGRAPNTAVTQETLLGLDEVGVTEYHPRRTLALNEVVTQALGGYGCAVLMRGLGALTVGGSLPEAVKKLRLVEMSAKLTFLTDRLGASGAGLTENEQRAANEV